MKSASASGLREASPTRSTREESTFSAKLQEIKRMRQEGRLGSNGGASGPGIVAPKKRLIINGKPAERRLGDWAQMKSSKGKVYYFHLKTLVNQWVEPADWKQLEEKERMEEEEAAVARLADLQAAEAANRAAEAAAASAAAAAAQKAKEKPKSAGLTLSSISLLNASGDNINKSGKVSEVSAPPQSTGVLPTKRPPSPKEPHPDLQNEDEERNRLAAPPKAKSTANGTAPTSAEGKTGFKMKLGKGKKGKKNNASNNNSSSGNGNGPSAAAVDAFKDDDDGGGKKLPPLDKGAESRLSGKDAADPGKKEDGGGGGGEQKENKKKKVAKKRSRSRSSSSSSSSSSSRSRSRSRSPRRRKPRRRSQSRSRSRSRNRSRSRSKGGSRRRQRRRSGSRSSSSSSSSSSSRSDDSRNKKRGRRGKKSQRSRSKSGDKGKEEKEKEKADPAKDALSATQALLPSLLPKLSANKFVPPSKMKPGLASLLEDMPKEPTDMSAVMAAKAKIESLMQKSGDLPTPSSTDAAGAKSAGSKAAAQGAAQIAAGLSHLTGGAINPTWFTEYNLPATLTRCKFPKTVDVLHEMQTNRSKPRPCHPLPPIPDAIVAASAGNEAVGEFEMRRAIFIAEVKNPNNRNRLLTEKLGDGDTVYKIPDELWDRYSSLFLIDLMDGVKLECRPNAMTEESTPLYARTGKVVVKAPFPEDVVRCHACIQAFRLQTCHLIYANKSYIIEREDNQWRKDLDECKQFLRENGY